MQRSPRRINPRGTRSLVVFAVLGALTGVAAAATLETRGTSDDVTLAATTPSISERR